MLFEVVGLGCGFGPLNNRFFPPMGSILYWLRPRTIRQPPWPRIPLTGGDERRLVDVVLYGALLVAIVVALFTSGSGPIPALNSTVGVLPAWQIWTILGLLAAIGLRDKTIFLAARGEVYGALCVTFLFTGVDMIIGVKLVFLVIWVGVATSRLNKHFPFVIATMMSSNPIWRSPKIKRKFFENFPDDLRPGIRSRWIAHFSTAVEGLVPIVLFFSTGGWVTAAAAVIMLIFHFGILSSIPMGVPLEWNVFMMFGIVTIFLGHPGIGLDDLNSPWPILLFVVSAGTVVLGNLLGERSGGVESSDIAARVDLPPRIRMVMGLPASGVHGFRRSHQQARSEYAMATLPGASSQIVGFGDRGVAVVSLLAQDLESTRAWVCEVLGGLADDTPNAAMLRHTLSVFLSTKESHLHTAEQLNLHRNTVG
ncbi:Sugar diacid utilization regulator [Gordonia bronchialis]|nr:Sugar diacid utilization regulator [Gordonia bronchialis]